VRLSRCRGCFGALRERLALVLSNGRQDVDAQLVGVRVIRRTNSTAGLHEGRHEGEIFGQLIQLCDYKPSLVRAASIDGARAASLFKIRLGGFALPSHISFLPVDIQTSSSNTDISLAEVH
jgi:hypothetical protein